MTFRIVPLPKSEFEGLFALSDEALAAQRARRMDPDTVAGMPCRVSLEDARAGETVLLLNYTPISTPTHPTAPAMRSVCASRPPKPCLPRVTYRSRSGNG